MWVNMGMATFVGAGANHRHCWFLGLGAKSGPQRGSYTTTLRCPRQRVAKVDAKPEAPIAREVDGSSACQPGKRQDTMSLSCTAKHHARGRLGRCEVEPPYARRRHGRRDEGSRSQCEVEPPYAPGRCTIHSGRQEGSGSQCEVEPPYAPGRESVRQPLPRCREMCATGAM